MEPTGDRKLLFKLDRNFLNFALSLYIPGFFINARAFAAMTTQLFVRETLRPRKKGG